MPTSQPPRSARVGRPEPVGDGLPRHRALGAGALEVEADLLRLVAHAHVGERGSRRRSAAGTGGPPRRRSVSTASGVARFSVGSVQLEQHGQVLAVGGGPHADGAERRRRPARRLAWRSFRRMVRCGRGRTVATGSGVPEGRGRVGGERPGDLRDLEGLGGEEVGGRGREGDGERQGGGEDRRRMVSALPARRPSGCRAGPAGPARARSASPRRNISSCLKAMSTSSSSEGFPSRRRAISDSSVATTLRTPGPKSPSR